MLTQFELTDRARDRVASLLSKEGVDAFLRIGIDGGGCAGFKYRFAMDKGVRPGDAVHGDGQARIVVDLLSQPFLDGARLDFVEDLGGSAFRVENPNAKTSCGCGTSFSA